MTDTTRHEPHRRSATDPDRRRPGPRRLRSPPRRRRATSPSPPSPTPAGISRATCYRRRDLRAIIDGYRSRHGELLTLTGLADRVDNLTQALDAVAAKVRRQEEEIRALKRRETTPTTRPTRKQTAD